jgi:hypothetical protein
MRNTWRNFVPVPWLRSLTNISKKHSKRLAQNFFGITISFDHMRVNFDTPSCHSLLSLPELCGEISNVEKALVDRLDTGRHGSICTHSVFAAGQSPGLGTKHYLSHYRRSVCIVLFSSLCLCKAFLCSSRNRGVRRNLEPRYPAWNESGGCCCRLHCLCFLASLGERLSAHLVTIRVSAVAAAGSQMVKVVLS